ncbi:MAG: HAD-IA family hydrolase [Methyloversatilis sp.]|jgi:2-haloacid dehalogenase|nr:HAD-IA family hydrolase [Methyloversatilis sp.]MBP6195528.1 HAD-IA family hydrolase [Methyloversatilis sp.]MBP9118319.1 HAD-IA family hydrolase [Methyloversatilis sp.]
MLDSAVRNAGLAPLLDKVLSVEQVGVFKPCPAAYQLACDSFDVKPEQVCFVSSNGWDAFSARAFGFNLVWCNRARQPVEHIPEMPDAEIDELLELPGVFR